MIKMPVKTRPGKPSPLGATWDGEGVNFALFSENATGVTLCLFDSVDAAAESHRIKVTQRTNLVWHIYLPDARPGWLYGYRVYGPYKPKAGHRFNPSKVLIDPYAKEIARTICWNESMLAYPQNRPKNDQVCDDKDNAAYAPLCKVIHSAYDWDNDQPPKRPWQETIIYETHIKGLTARHPDIPEPLRGTYSGLASEPMLDYLLNLGITAVELLPIHHHVDDWFLVKKNLTNYWGYNTLAYFSPDLRYGTGKSSPVDEFKDMVKSLHKKGIEVILDVVFNHTGEGDRYGPTLSFRGIDNRSYYRLLHESPEEYTDYTGCGNTLNVTHPQVLKLIMDSLRYWIEEMHVDGFRFDLASTLAREPHDFNRASAFLDIIYQDPVISQVKLIAEPWDLGEGGYQVGNFPLPWSEWNGKYRDAVRKFWKGEVRQTAEFATRLAGSSDLYDTGGRSPYASINFITSHDGFTLKDLVSYHNKQNKANLENNQDGENENHSWNCGAEGPTKDPHIQALREQQQRNLMATLLISQGVPMISGGDEMGRSQEGNNNAYCQDNRISWHHWPLDPKQSAFLEFTKYVIRIRKNPVFRRLHFFQGRKIHGSEIKDLTWLSPSGKEMRDAEWHDALSKCLGMKLSGEAAQETDAFGESIQGETLLILMNAGPDTVPFTLPYHRKNLVWELLIDTTQQNINPTEHVFYNTKEAFPLSGHALAIFQLKNLKPEKPPPI